jgi:hypothetical protein
MTFKINATGLVKLFLERYRHWCDHQNFYKEFHPPQIVDDPLGISCFHHRDIDNINACSDNIIAIDSVPEGINIAHRFNKYNPDKHYIIFTNGRWKEDAFPLNIRYTLINNMYFLFDYADVYLSPNRFNFYLDKDYRFDYPKQNNFMSTVGNIRPERTYFVDQMIEKCSYENFILRYSGEDLGMPSNQFDVINFSKGKFDPYSPITPMLEQHNHTVGHSLPIKMYNTAYFNVVVETDIDYNNEFFMTEKTVKALITGIPFVIVSTPNFLKNLKSLGFLTYDNFWDESYDAEIDYKTRIDKIVELCNNLGSFDWAKHRTELETIKLRNRNNFMNLNWLASQEFYEFENKIKNIPQ